jgi:hypothetical protein
MKRRTNPLDHVRVAAPCPAEWERMIGTEQVRFCAQCNLNVYNLSGMTRKDAERLIVQHEGRLCVRYYRRADGTILTRNCPVGLRALRRRLSRMASAVATMILGFLAGIFAFVGLQKNSPVDSKPAQGYTQGVIATRKPTAQQNSMTNEQGESDDPQSANVLTGNVAIDPAIFSRGKRARAHR